MSNIPLIKGGGQNRVLKLTPNNNLIPSAITNIDNLFSFSNLNNSKFDLWKSIATNTNKIGIIDANSGLETIRYIDPNNETMWFLGNSEENYCYYLQAGENIIKSNNPEVFTTGGCIACHGYLETGTPINILNRCGDEYNPNPADITTQQTGVIDVGYGMNGSSSVVKYDDTLRIPLNNINKFTIKMLMKQTVLGTESLWLNHGVGANIYCINDTNIQVSMDYLSFYANFDPTGIIFSDTFFVIDMVYDGTQTGNANRFKIRVNGVDVNLSFTGDVPAKTINNSTAILEFGTNGYSFDGILDETRIMPEIAETIDESVLRYNQWTNQSNYWTVTIQPIITNIIKISNNKWKIEGTGFKPEETNPTGTINGIEFDVEDTTDTSFIAVGNNIVEGTKIFIINNSDDESDFYISDLTDLKTKIRCKTLI